MSEYTLVLQISNAGNKEIIYTIKLTGANEDYPEDYFLVETHKLKLQIGIETKIARKVGNTQLNYLIQEWIQDIKQGLQRTTIRLNLPAEVIPITEGSVKGKHLQDERIVSYGNSHPLISNQMNLPQPKPPKQQTRQPEKESKTKIEKRSTKNKQDF